MGRELASGRENIGVTILKSFSTSHQTHFQQIPSPIDDEGNAIANVLAKAGACDSSNSSAPLTYFFLMRTFIIPCTTKYHTGAYIKSKVCGRGNRVVKVSDRGGPCHEFEPSTTKDPPCRAAMQVKSVESSNVLPLVVWCGSSQRGYQLRCHPRHLTMVQNDMVRRQKPSCN
ncbi:uncharacterized protein TNCV_4132561 [Trichonephila clavipes]|nr:uncharacterized protein TNCV_4132561 [Trichonephila clavipes]